MGNYDEMALAVEMLSGGKNKVILDDVGLPGVYVVIPKGSSGSVVKDGDTSRVHPAFIVNSVEKDEIFISKYLNFVYNNRAYSLPKRDPKASLNQATAKTYCTNKGKGFHLMTMPEWGYVALWAKKNGTMPHGNNNYGKDSAYPYETAVGVGAKDGSNRIQHTATGTGPVTWAHDHTNAGIFDLNGNVSEWQDGVRIMDGEIQVIANNDAAQGADCDTSATSTLWKAIMPDGTLVAPGTAGTLHYDWLSSKITLTTSTTETTDQYRQTAYKDLVLATGVNCPAIIKDLILYPDDPGQDVYGGDQFYINPVGERLPGCGGYWNLGACAGVFFVYLSYPRSGASASLGFRSAFVNL
jgi:hypothetical protein